MICLSQSETQDREGDPGGDQSALKSGLLPRGDRSIHEGFAPDRMCHIDLSN